MSSRVFKLFLSSTFGDFQAEREALRERVWPKLEHFCKAKGAAFQVVDLRWGISEADGLSHDTLRICLDEVARCRQISPKPNFVMLIGDRYGWRPLPPEIPAVEFEEVNALLNEESEKINLLHRWYRRDDNAIPPHYRLLPRDGEYASTSAWENVETQLTAILRDSVRVLGMTPERRERYFLSATHLEIVRGTLAASAADEQVLAIFRNIDGIESLSSLSSQVSRFTDVANGVFDEEASSLRAELRAEVTQSIPDSHRFNYRCQWIGENEGPISTNHIDDLCADIERSLLDVISRELDVQKGDLLDQEIERHAQFANERCEIFIGRDSEISQLQDWIHHAIPKYAGVFKGNKSTESKFVIALFTFIRFVKTRIESFMGRVIEILRLNNRDRQEKLPSFEYNEDANLATLSSQPQLLIHGQGGVGKSAFMARATTEIEQWNPEAVVIRRFIGASPQSIDLCYFVGDLLREISRRYVKPENLPDGGLKELLEELPVRLAYATQYQPLILAIDALDQFSESLETRHHLWLPQTLPKYVALVMSMIDGPINDAAQRKFPDATSITMSSFSRSEGGGLLDALLRAGDDVDNKRKRCLTFKQRAVVLDSFAADGRPLYIKIAVNFVRRWPSWIEPEKLPDSLERLIHLMVKHLREVHGASIADRALDYISASRFGLSDDEIRNLLWRDEEVRTEFSRRKNNDQPEVDTLPPVIWSRIYFDLAPYLTAQSIDGMLLYRFYHRVVGEVIAKDCLANDEQLVHSRLAKYFEDQPLYSGEGTEKVPNARKIMEQPWQLIIAGELGRAEALITSFDFGMAKCRANRFDDLLEDFLRLVEKKRENHQPLSSEFAAWEEFYRSKAHFIRRSSETWPAHKVLLQLAAEYPEGTPITQSVDEWLSQGKCDWVWIRDLHRPEHDHANASLCVFEGHAAGIQGVQVLADGRILSWSRDRNLRLWDGQSGKPLVVLSGHTGHVNGALVLAEGYILSWADDDTLRLWDVKNGEPFAVLSGHTGYVNGAQVLANGRILSWSEDNTLRLWDVKSGESIVVLRGHTGFINGAQVLADGRILSWSEDKTLRLWDLKTGKHLRLRRCRAARNSSVHVLADGHILFWSEDKTLRISDMKNGEPFAVLRGHTGYLHGTQVLADGRILSWSEDNTLRLWDVKSDEPLAVLTGHTGFINGAQVLADGRILSWAEDNRLRLWDSDSGDCLIVFKGHKLGVNGARVLADGRILSWSKDKTLRLWDGNSGTCLLVLEGHCGFVIGTIILTDDRILSWSDDKTLRIWKFKDGGHKEVSRIAIPDVIDVKPFADGRVLTWSRDRKIRLWDSQSAQPLLVLEGHTNDINGVQILADGRVLSWSRDSTLRLWDGQSGESLEVLKGHSSNVDGAQVLADCRILSWSSDSLRLWNGQSGKPLAKLERLTGIVAGVQDLADGRILFWSNDKVLRLWNRKSRKPLAKLRGHMGIVRGVQVSTDGRILSWSEDKTLRLWDGLKYSTLFKHDGHTGAIKGALFLPDGRFISWSRDGALLLWDGISRSPLIVNQGGYGPIRSVQLIDDCRVLICHKKENLRLWDVNNNTTLLLEGHTGILKGVHVLSDERIVSWSADCTVRLWETRTGKCLDIWLQHGLLHVRVDKQICAKTEILPSVVLLAESDSLPDGTVLHWFDDAVLPIRIVSVDINGVICVLTASNKLRFLQTYRGSKSFSWH